MLVALVFNDFVTDYLIYLTFCQIVYSLCENLVFASEVKIDCKYAIFNVKIRGILLIY